LPPAQATEDGIRGTVGAERSSGSSGSSAEDEIERALSEDDFDQGADLLGEDAEDPSSVDSAEPDDEATDSDGGGAGEEGEAEPPAEADTAPPSDPDVSDDADTGLTSTTTPDRAAEATQTPTAAEPTALPSEDEETEAAPPEVPTSLPEVPPVAVSTPPTETAPLAAGGVPAEGYRIGAGDVLDVVVWKNEQLTRSVTVRPDGKISLPLVNDIEAAGLTPANLRDVLVKKLAEYVPSPEVSVLVSKVQSFEVSVIGEVQKPGRFDLRGRTTVLDALALAGGLSEFASRGKIFVLRHEGEATTRIRFDYDDAISADEETQPLILQPGDIVVVP
jgi:polysaccharide export outer membrane protein